MVLKFHCRESRFLNMGIGFLKKLIQEAKESKDVITLEATVITGFEFFALEECREKLKPLNSNKSKGRIFFNIKTESYPNVLKMRMIDNVFLVTESFEELKLKNIKDEDLLTIKNLVEQVDWGKSVPQWAKIVGFKGVQFPKCAQKNPNEPLDLNEPSCQSCLMAKKDGAGVLTLIEDGGESSVKNGDFLETDLDSPKLNPISDQQAFQPPPDKCTVPEGKILEPESSSSNGDLIGSPEVQSMPPTVQLLQVKQTQETDDDCSFYSAEEDFLIEEPLGNPLAAGDPLDKIRSPEQELLNPETDQNVPLSLLCSDQMVKCDGTLTDPAILENDFKQAEYEKPKLDRANHREARKDCEDLKSANVESNDAAKTDEGPPDDAISQTGSELPEGPTQAKPKERKSYWQKRKEAKAKKSAEAKAKKPPRKPYIDDGIMKFRVTCYRNGPKHSFDSNDAAGHFGGLINDKFHWTVDLTRHDINVVLVIEEDSAYVTLALTNNSLHRRNIKYFAATTLRATLCYGLMRLAEPCVGDIVMDPMCGGGSIPIEGALAFPRTFHICGDVSAKCVALTGDNVAHNSQQKPLLVDPLQWSVRRLPIRDSVIDVFITDLPFGLRVGKQKDNTGLYIAALTEVARVVRTCGRASLLTYDKMAMTKALRITQNLWREIRVNTVNQGGLRCFAYLLLRKARAPLPSAPPAVPTQQLSELDLQGPAIAEPNGEHSSEVPELIQELDLQNREIPEPNDLPAESLTNQPNPDGKCSDDTKCA